MAAKKKAARQSVKQTPAKGGKQTAARSTAAVNEPMPDFVGDKSAQAATQSASCFHCGRAVHPKDEFCHGCKKYICERCGKNLSLMGSHDPDEHLIAEDDDDDGDYDDDDFDDEY